MNPLELISSVYSICSRINDCIKDVQANKGQCSRLGNRLKIIVDTLQGLSRVTDTAAFRKALSDLEGHMKECEGYVKKFTSKKGWIRFLQTGKDKGELERLNGYLAEDLLQLNVGINVQQLMNREDDETDRKKDAEELLTKQDEILKLVTEDSGKLDDVRKTEMDILAFLRELRFGAAAAPSQILIEAEDVECGAKIAQGVSVIYRGHFRGQDVAVKTFKQALDDAARDQFAREVKILEGLRSDHIVLFYGACLKPNKECLVMKYMAGGSLSSVLEKRQSFTPELQKRTALEIAKGLHYLHSQGMIHRDLKDRHVLFDEDWHAKLTGFGLSKVKSGAVQTAQGTHELSFWSAPELFARHGCHTAKSDIYSYGLILWELLTEQKPYLHLGLDLAVLLEKITTGYRESIPDSMPKIYADLIRQCWDPDPSKRPGLEIIIREIEVHTPQATNLAAEELYRIGVDCEKAHHYGEAVDYYTRSAEKGYPRAKTGLGLFFLRGTGVPANKTKAFALLSDAAAAGHARAQFNLGMMLEYGDGVKKDYEQALSWYQKSSAQGDEDAKARVHRLIEKMEKAAACNNTYTAPKP